MAVIAITPFRFGREDGSVEEIEVGAKLDGRFDEDQLAAFVEGGSAVETGKDKKYAVAGTSTPTLGVSTDDTRKRDEIIAKALFDSPDEVSPGVAAAAGVNAQIIAQVQEARAAEKDEAVRKSGQQEDTLDASTTAQGTTIGATEQPANKATAGAKDGVRSDKPNK